MTTPRPGDSHPNTGSLRDSCSKTGIDVTAAPRFKPGLRSERGYPGGPRAGGDGNKGPHLRSQTHNPGHGHPPAAARGSQPPRLGPVIPLPQMRPSGSQKREIAIPATPRPQLGLSRPRRPERACASPRGSPRPRPARSGSKQRAAAGEWPRNGTGDVAGDRPGLGVPCAVAAAGEWLTLRLSA